MDSKDVGTDIIEAARNLEQRFELLRVPAHGIQFDGLSWTTSVPLWLRELLAHHRLVGGVLEYRDKVNDWQRIFSFFDVVDFVNWYSEDGLGRDLQANGYFPFANESDGSVWIMPIDNAPREVFLLEFSEWDGGLPTERNGLRFAASGLHFLMASMAVSGRSYPSSCGTPGYVMWHRAGSGGT